MPSWGDTAMLLLRLTPASPTVTPLWSRGPWRGQEGPERGARAALHAGDAAQQHRLARAEQLTSVRLGSTAFNWARLDWAWLCSAAFNWARLRLAAFDRAQPDWARLCLAGFSCVQLSLAGLISSAFGWAGLARVQIDFYFYLLKP